MCLERGITKSGVNYYTRDEECVHCVMVCVCKSRRMHVNAGLPVCTLLQYGLFLTLCEYVCGWLVGRFLLGIREGLH